MQAENEVGVTYLFVREQPPTDCTFVYKTPGAIMADPVRLRDPGRETAVNQQAAATDAAMPDARRRAVLRRRLRAWYAKHARDLPWRRSADPYAVWLSEIMLQQTQVATVKAYFERFMRAFPTIRDLAAADEREVLRLWEGLGYYRRARQLHQAAQVVVEQHGGQFPRDPQSVGRLPGIGRYTAGAILSIAFDARQPILEANTLRLHSRLLAYGGDPASAAGQRSALGHGRGRAAEARRRHVQSGLDGAGQHGLFAQVAPLRRLPRGHALPHQRAGIAGRDSPGQGPAARRSGQRGGRGGSSPRPGVVGAMSRRRPLGRAVGLPAIRRRRGAPRRPSPRSGRRRAAIDRRRDRAGRSPETHQARRHAVSHHVGLLRGPIRRPREWKAGNDRNEMAAAGPVERLSAEHDGTDSGKAAAGENTGRGFQRARDWSIASGSVGNGHNV